MPCSTRLRTIPCVVEGASSSRAAISERLIRRAPWSAVSTRIARSIDWITWLPFLLSTVRFAKTIACAVNHGCMVHITFDYTE